MMLSMSLLLLGCHPEQPKPVPSPGNDDCAAAEKKLLDLGCKDRRGRYIGGPNLHGVPWAQQCRDFAAVDVDVQPKCIVQAVDCEGVMACR